MYYIVVLGMPLYSITVAYSSISAWAIYYMWFSLQSVLPWTICGEWASNCCKLDNETKSDPFCTRDDQFDPITNASAISNWTSPSQEFWE